jgi:hypothetical protein
MWMLFGDVSAPIHLETSTATQMSDTQDFSFIAQQLAWLEGFLRDMPASEETQRLEAAIEEFVPTWSLAPIVRALQALLSGWPPGRGRARARHHARTLDNLPARRDPLCGPRHRACPLF